MHLNLLFINYFIFTDNVFKNYFFLMKHLILLIKCIIILNFQFNYFYNFINVDFVLLNSWTF